MFQIIRVYDDGGAITDNASNIINALNACAIYLEDPSCIVVKIIDRTNNKTVMEYWA